MTVLRRLGLRSRAAARGRISSITFLGWLVLAIAIAVGAGGSTRAGATGTSCTTAGYTVAPLHGTRFYVDSSSNPVLDSGYTGVSVTSTSAASNVWVQLSNFVGGVLGLNSNQPAALPLGNLTANSTTPAYFFLTAGTVGDSSVAQTFDVNVYQGDPSHGGTLLCTYGDGYSAGLMDTIKAAANKVQDVTGDSIAASVSTSSPVVGGTVTLTVEGSTGTLGSGPDGQPFIYETPDALSNWPAGSFRLVGTTLTLSPGASQTVYTNSLQLPQSTTSAQNYIVQYTFRITGTTASSTQPYPIQEISSGTQVKHTDPSTLASTIPAIAAPTNTLTLTQVPSTTSLPSTGGNVTYTATLHSTSSSSSSLDEVISTLPANGTYVAGSAKLDGSTIADPTVSSGTLVFPGPFSVSSAADRTIAFTVSLPATAGTYVDSTIGYVASTQIDTTTSTSDNAPASSSTTVARAAQTITFTQPSDTRADQGPVSLSGSATSGLTVSFSSSTPSVCTVSGTSVTLLAAGTCTIAASQAGNAQYLAASNVTQSFQVTAAPQAQTITFPKPADTRVDQGPVSLSATASSGLTVSYASSTTSVCTVSGSSVTLVAVGTCTIAASQAGNGSYAAATPVSKSFEVTAAPQAQTITFPQPASTAVNAGPVSLSATASSGLTVSYASSTSSVCTVSGSSVTLVSVGTCTIAASQAGNASYTAATPVSQSFQVTQAGQTIIFPQPADTAANAGPVSLGATASSALAVSYASLTTSVCTVSGASVALVAAGTCSITATQGGNASYAAATPVTKSFQVTNATQTITFPQPGDLAATAGPVTLGATASSGLTVTYASSTPSVCTVSGSSVTLLATGACTITASQIGDSTYAAATQVTKSFEVTGATQTITFAAPASTRVDGGPVSLAASASSGLTVSFTSNSTVVCTVSGTSVTPLTTGTCSITASQTGDSTYTAALPVTRTFSVTALAQTITFPQPADTRVDQGPVSLGATASSGLAVSYASSTTAVCTVAGSSVTLIATGTCTITASQGGNGTYAAAADAVQSFRVTAAPVTPTAQSITFPQPADTRVDQGPVSLTASASSGLAVTYASSTTSVCTVSGSSVVLVATGTCTITASQAGNSTYAAATDVSRSFQVTAVPVVTPTAQTITFASPADTRVDQGPVTLGATASSGLAVSYASSTTNVCTVSGSSVTLVATGTCTITASQAGDATYAAATDVTRSFQVTAVPSSPSPTAQSISFPQPADTRVDQGQVSLGATASSGLAVSYASSTTSVCTVSGSSVTLVAAGTCTITASQSGDSTYSAATPVSVSLQVTAVPVAPGGQTITFPQPADTQVDQGPVSLGATASSGLGVSYASSTGTVCTVSGSSVTLLTTGTCTITASQAGDSTYSAATDVTRSFQVTLVASPVAAPPAPAPAPAPAPTPQRRSQTIAFAPVPPLGGGALSVAVSASATSGLAVSYDTATPAVCSVAAGGLVTILAAGDCTIVARQPGNGDWLAAPDASTTFAVTLPPLPMPSTEQKTTVAGKTTQSIVGGIPDGASIALDGKPALPGVQKVTFVGTHVVVTPTTTFSGLVDVPIVVTKDGRTVETTVPVLVRPKAPTEIAVTPLSSKRSEIAWEPSASATGYVVRVDGRVVCTTKTTSCDLPTLLSPSSNVVVTSLGNAGTVSDDAPGRYRPRTYVLIAIVHFASASSTLEAGARRILLSTEGKIAKGRFKHAMLTCHTDNVGSLPYNMALSAARCASVGEFIKRQLGISHITYKQATFAFLHPVAPNSTVAGMAENRRVEVYVR